MSRRIKVVVPAMLQRLQQEVRTLFFDDAAVEGAPSSRWRQFLRFWVQVGRSFSKNRCPLRASALAYSSLLAFVPFLAIVIGVSTSLLKGDKEKQRIEGQVDVLLNNLVPQLMQNAEFADMKKEVLGQIFSGIGNVNSGGVGTTGIIAFLVMILFMLARVEDTLNDIWGVSQGRSWYARMVNYWAAISLGPVVMVAAISFSAILQLPQVEDWIKGLPLMGPLLLNLAPVPILGGACALFYALMPNTKVNWRAALIGGLVAGLLWHLNNQLSVKFVAQISRYKAVYGTLAALPVFMVGLYFFWLLLLFGAQVAHTFQNRLSYLASRMSSRVHQDGREWVAVRVMMEAARAFAGGKVPPTASELASRLQIPHPLMVQVTGTLLATRLLVEAGSEDVGLLPARPIEVIRVADVLDAMRRGVGQRPGSGPDPEWARVERELSRVSDAERVAGDRTLAQLVAPLTS